MSERYLLSRVPGVDNAWHCIDSVTGVSVTLTGSRVNDTQSAAWPDGLTLGSESPAQLARVMRLMADWLFENHSELLCEEVKGRVRAESRCRSKNKECR